MTRVHQALSGAGPYDAVTSQALAWRGLLSGWGLAGGVHADTIDPRARGAVEPLARLDPAPGDLLVIRHSAHSPRLAPLLEWPQRKLLVYHNVTPARYLWRHQPQVAVACALGRSRLPRFARAADVAVADSELNAGELRAAGAGEVRVVPILFDPERLSRLGTSPAPPGDGPLILTVGRLAPNKRHDLVLAAFAAYQRACEPDARLLCVGEPLTPEYGELVEGLARRCGARNVRIAHSVPQPDLNAAYAEAAALLSMSEHEGFCIPLLEAFHFGLPVVARPAGAMPEVGADAVLWAPDGDPNTTPDIPTVAEFLDLAVRDPALRTELARRAQTRLAHYASTNTATAIRAAIDAALG